MKKVIFICLLSLSMCLSKPAEQPGDPASTNTTIPTTKKTDSKTIDVVAPTKPTSTNETTLAPKVEPEKQTANNTSEPAHNETKVVTTEAPKADTDKDNKSNKTSPPPTTAAKTEKPAPAAEPVKTNTTAKPEVNPTTAVSTQAPPVNPDKNVNVQARHFDGPSFIGGIILTLGMLAIGFMGFKYYKNQTERNYHTL